MTRSFPLSRKSSPHEGQVEDFYVSDRPLGRAGGERQHKHPPHEQPALAEPEEASARTPKLDLTVEPSLDSLGSTWEIGKVPLKLTADREIYLAKRIERGDMYAKTQMIEPTCAWSCRSRRVTWSAASASST